MSEERKKELAEMLAGVKAEQTIDAAAITLGFAGSAMVGELVAMLVQKGILSKDDYEKLKKIAAMAAEQLGKQYEDIGKKS